MTDLIRCHAHLVVMQMFYDDLPIWGFIGKVEKILRTGEKPDLKFFLFTHIHFEVLYNNNRVVEINISTDPARTVDITEGDNIIVDYTYSVKWKSTPTPYEKRMDKYSKYSFLPQHLEVTLTRLVLTFSLSTSAPCVLSGSIDASSSWTSFVQGQSL